MGKVFALPQRRGASKAPNFKFTDWGPLKHRLGSFWYPKTFGWGQVTAQPGKDSRARSQTWAIGT